MMQIIISQKEKNKRIFERVYTQNYFFEPYNNVLTVYPIPEFITKPLCVNCGKPAECMDEKFNFLCLNCLNNERVQSELKSENALIIPSIENFFRKMAFEWRTKEKEQRYNIKGSNIKFDSKIIMDKNEKRKRIVELMKKVIFEKEVSCDAEYDKDAKTLTVII